LNLDQSFPNQVFTAVIWESTRALFKFPPESLAGKSICVTGRIKDFKGKAEIIVDQPSQIIVQP
jgi:DNA/RNA endonuclease YhcR with UshA esterase domain